MYYIHVAVPIDTPPFHRSLISIPTEEFMFDRSDRMKKYISTRGSKDTGPFFIKDDHQQWYFLTYFTGKTLSDLKWARQIHRPSYADEENACPLVDVLKNEKVIAKEIGFDKAYAHTNVFVKTLKEYTPLLQSRLANVDGEDDPQLVTNIHYVKNVYKGQETRYISGAETRSFATVTENKEYFHTIHLHNTAFLYLQYFVYHQEHHLLPSNQMAPRLFGNLWNSKMHNQTNWNASLLEIEAIN